MGNRLDNLFIELLNKLVGEIVSYITTCNLPFLFRQPF